MTPWEDYFHSDKVLLAVVLAMILGLWWATREPKLYDLATTVIGALIAIITGTAIRKEANNGKPPTQ